MSQAPSTKSTAPAPAGDWAGLDPSQLEGSGGRNRTLMFVGPLAVYILIAVAVVWLLVSPSQQADDTDGGNTLRGAPIDAGTAERNNRNSPANAYDPVAILANAQQQRVDGRWLPLGFDVLTSFEVPDLWAPIGALNPPSRPEIPDYIHALDQEEISIVGYASTHFLGEQGRSREFILFRTRDQCCFGAPALPHEVILCHVEDEKGLDLQDGVPMRIKGVLEIAPEYDGDFLLGVYRLEARDAKLVEH